MTPVLEIVGLHVRHHDGTLAVRGLDLALGASERLAVLGPNGSGKTSLLLAVARGLAFEGRIVVDGIESSRREAHALRRRCGMVFQDADDQLFMPTLLEDAAFGPLNHGSAPEQATASARRALEAVGLGGLEDRSPHHLSGGQKRSAALATVLSMDVKLLLLDEPAANLDCRCRRRLTELLAGRPEAMLLATHDLDMVGALCSRAVILEQGRIAAEGSAADILADRGLLERHGLV